MRYFHTLQSRYILEIVESIKQGNDNNISKQDAKQIFVSNAEQEIDANWKTYALAGIESPLPLIMQDLNIRADRLADNLTRDDEINSGDGFKTNTRQTCLSIRNRRGKDGN